MRKFRDGAEDGKSKGVPREVAYRWFGERGRGIVVGVSLGLVGGIINST